MEDNHITANVKPTLDNIEVILYGNKGFLYCTIEHSDFEKFLLDEGIIVYDDVRYTKDLIVRAIGDDYFSFLNYSESEERDEAIIKFVKENTTYLD